LKKFWCHFTCSPDQDQWCKWINIKQVTNGILILIRKNFICFL
jgi:hypothetical protein